ncbi:MULTISPECIES: septum site-determining protein Ssd [unclassified Arthrobacter]|uniref:septum site-determining protein Ssd n=1 Tax=unclassified Arthrobacter TaxID=235627 RepID=UPI0015E23183|nr:MULTISPECIES: septum site-determining protein Ssd [unclassified Arthrobacter]
MSEEQLWVPSSGHRRARALRAQFPAEHTRAPARFNLRTESAPSHSTARGPSTSAPVILISASQRIQDEVARIAAAAGVELEVIPDAAAAFQRNPEVMLLGSDLAGVGPGHRMSPDRNRRRRAETILVGFEQDTDLWKQAARLEAARVAVLPAASGWLAEYLGRRREHNSGFVLGVVGGSGGAGASTLSCWLAQEAAEHRMETLLVDGDPLGGGLDASLGSGEVPGVRWPDLAEVRGALNPVQLTSALPRVSGFALLAGGSADSDADDGEAGPGYSGTQSLVEAPAEESIRAVMDAARAAFALTIVDCARHLPGQLLLSCDALLVVVPGRLRPVLAARSLSRSLGGTVPKAAVVRGPLGDGLDDARAADAAGLPLAGYLPATRRLEHAEARGLLLQRGRSRSIRRVTGQLVERFAAEVPQPADPRQRPLS